MVQNSKFVITHSFICANAHLIEVNVMNIPLTLFNLQETREASFLYLVQLAIVVPLSLLLILHILQISIEILFILSGYEISSFISLHRTQISKMSQPSQIHQSAF